MDSFLDHLRSLRRKRREFIICADWNICHKEIDLSNWRPTAKTPAFCPRSGPGWTCSTTRSATSTPSGWSTRSRTSTPGGPIVARPGPRTSGGGWITRSYPGWRDKVRAAAIYKDERFSDHAPQIMEYELDDLHARRRFELRPSDETLYITRVFTLPQEHYLQDIQ